MALVRSRGPGSCAIGELGDLFAMQHLDASWVWGWVNAAPEVMKYVIPEGNYLFVVDRQPETLNRAFALGFLAALTTRELEQSLAAYPGFGKRVKRLADLRRRTAAFTTRGRFRDALGLSLKGCLGYVFESDQGIGVTLAEVTGRRSRFRAVLDPGALGLRATGPGKLHLAAGGSQRSGATFSGRRMRLSRELAGFEVAVWFVPCHPAADQR
jgi:hypothetical protein